MEKGKSIGWVLVIMRVFFEKWLSLLSCNNIESGKENRRCRLEEIELLRKLMEDLMWL